MSRAAIAIRQIVSLTNRQRACALPCSLPPSLCQTSPISQPFSSVHSLLALPSISSRLFATSNMTQMENGTSKRKDPPTATSHRPLKQARSHLSPRSHATDITNGVSTAASPADSPDIHLSPEMSEDDEPTFQAATITETPEWQATIERVVSNVVSIHFCQTAPFDTDPALSSEATGFIVDAKRGYILTNRHVVGAGPFWGYCIFDNHEECDVHPVYRDPVHDFGILRFDPKAIKYLQLAQLELRPDLAKVGAEIRVVGNDAGEKLSILSGVISRLDRNVPEYGEGYSDFNTNYIQAAASASGGSSGSPVVNIDGFAVALQAGGRSDGAATDYFLPLDRPLRALQCVRAGQAVTRGDIQVQFLIKAFDECRRLGLSADWEAEVRQTFPKETGMLVAEIVLPDGPAHGKLEEGDILLKVNGILLTQFTRLDAILDDSVGSKVTLLIQRSGQNQEVEVEVGDLHAITPDRYVTVAGASFHDLSYQQARFFAVSLKNAGAYCCDAAGSFRFDGTEYGWLIQSVDNKPTSNLSAFINVVKAIPDRSRVVVTYKHLRDMHTVNTGIVLVDRHWNKSIRMAVRNDDTGLWDFTDLADALPAVAQVPRKAAFVSMEGTQYPMAAEVIRSFVRVSAIMPIRIDGYPRTRKTGYGLVIDAAKGLVIISRAIVPYDLCDLSITIADSIIVSGKVIFMHPLQNYAIVQYDPALVQAPVRSAKLATQSIKQGESTIFFGFNQNFRPVIAKTTVTDITTVGIPSSSSTPRYRAVNLDAITVDTNLSGQCGSGVLVAEDGTVQALWLTYLGERTASTGKDVEYFLGFATPALLPVIEQIKGGERPDLHILNLENQTVQMAQARIMGVSEEWLERVQREDPERHQLFMVRKVDAGHVNGLAEGDIILTLNDRLITRVSDFDIMYNNVALDAVVVRQKEVKQLQVTTVPTSSLETDRIVVFCGAILHRPHHAVRQQISKIHSDVYISGRIRGSPAYMYGLSSTHFIMAVNAVPTPDLATFITETNKIKDNTYFRLKLMTFDNVPWVATLKKNEHYFPTVEFVKDASETEGWRRVKYEDGKIENGQGEVPQETDQGAAESVEIE